MNLKTLLPTGVARYSRLEQKTSLRQVRFSDAIDGDVGEKELEPEEQALRSSQAQQMHAVAIANILYPVVAVCAFIILITGGVYWAHLSNPSSRPPVRLCGNSSAEALALGCTFDQLVWAWLPPGCPHHANDEFLKADNWTYYIDGKGTKAVGENWIKVLDNEMMAYGERREHATHCVYLLLSLARMVYSGDMRFTPKQAAPGHVDHCVEFLQDLLRKDEDWYKITNQVGWVSYEESCYT